MTVPNDFPREPVQASLAGVQPKIPVRFDATSGRYTNAQAEAYVVERYQICEDLADQLVAKCRKNRDTKYAHLDEGKILERLLAQLLATDWGSKAEMRWVIRRTALDLGWEVPESAVIIKPTLGSTQ